MFETTNLNYGKHIEQFILENYHLSLPKNHVKYFHVLVFHFMFEATGYYNTLNWL